MYFIASKTGKIYILQANKRVYVCSLRSHKPVASQFVEMDYITSNYMNFKNLNLCY